ncbi:MAG: glutaredoxin family protein [Archangium sp.]|nr:glutaredoxin family protein [Archangium sp.]
MSDPSGGYPGERAEGAERTDGAEGAECAEPAEGTETAHGPGALPDNEPMPDPAALPTVDRITVHGADWCGDCRRTKRFLDRTGTPYAWVDTAADKGARITLNEAGYLAIPVVLLPGGTVLVEPTDDDLAEAIAVGV